MPKIGGGGRHIQRQLASAYIANALRHTKRTSSARSTLPCRSEGSFRVCNIGGLASQAGVLRRGDRLRHERWSIAILRRSDINGENKGLDA